MDAISIETAAPRDVAAVAAAHAGLHRRRSARRQIVLAFLLLSVLYHSNLRPVAAGDSLPAAIVPFSIVLDRSIALDRFGPYVNERVWYASAVLRKSNGRWYSVYPIAGPLMVSPLYLPAAFIPPIGKLPPAALISLARVVEKAVAAALAAVAAIALWFLLRRLTSDRKAWMLALLFAVGTGNWSTSSQALWQHTFGQLAIIAWLYSIERLGGCSPALGWRWMAGAAAGCALAIRPTNIALLPALAVVLWLRRDRLRDWLRVFAPPAAAAGLLAAYNYAVFRSFAGGYPATLDGSFVDGLLGSLLSPGRGLLVYTPAAAFALAAFAPRARENRERQHLLVAAASVFSLLHVVMVAMWPVWWGGYCWGPRLLTEMLAPVIVLIAVGLPALRVRGLRAAFAGAALYGCFIQALGVYCYPKGRWDHLPVSVNDDPGRLWNWADNPVVRTARGGVAWEPYAIVAELVRGGLPAASKKIGEMGISAY